MNTHVDALQGDEAVADHLIERREHGLDLVVGVDAFDDYREVLGETQDVGGVENAGLAEPFDPAQDGRPGKTSPPEQLDDRLIEGATIVSVGLADEYTEQSGVVAFHIVQDVRVYPRAATATPAMRLVARLTTPRRVVAPSRTVSTIQVE